MADMTKTATAGRDKAAWTHFAVVATILGIFAIGVNPLLDEPLLKLVGWVLQKSPVPWPDKVTVDSTTMRNTSLAKVIGPYRRVEADGLLDWQDVTDDSGRVMRNPNGTVRREPVYDGEPDGERIFDDELLESLKINTQLDEARYPDRTSNWYVSRIYEDTRPGRQHRLWGLDVYYYTGNADTVAHVPQICGEAGGGRASEPVVKQAETENLPEAWSQWKEFGFHLIVIERMTDEGLQHNRQYYIFCTNGQQGLDRITDVRLRLADPTKEYVYFMKAQWYPYGESLSPEATDAEAREFIETILPEVLSQVPTAETLDALEAAD